MSALRPLTLLLPPFFCLLLLLPAGGAAEGLYLALDLGMNRVVDAAAEDDQGSFNLHFAPAPLASLAVGRLLPPDSSLGSGRLELEYARRTSPLKRIELADGTFPASGDLTVQSLLLNSCAVQPLEGAATAYFGVGLGAARVAAAGLKVTSQPLSTASATVFAYQLTAGIDYPVSDTLSLDAGYRFFATARPRLREADGSQWRSEYFSHAALIGVRLSF